MSLQEDVFAGEKPIIFPVPQEISVADQYFEMNENVRIVIPDNPSDNDLYLARSLVRELSDKYGIVLGIESASKRLAQKQFILIGSISNALVNEYCKKEKITISANQPGTEGYLLCVPDRIAVVAGSDEKGIFYGLQSLRQLIKKDRSSLTYLPFIYERRIICLLYNDVNSYRL